MFTQTSKPRLRDRVLRSPLVDLLTGPHGVDRYTELVEPTWTLGDSRAKVVAVRRQTTRSVTLTLEPNAAFRAGPAFRAGQHINFSVEVDGRRLTRCYSPANAENDAHIELTVGLHDGGAVSQHLYRNARPGMVVGLEGVGGEFVLPAVRPRTHSLRLRRQWHYAGVVHAADHERRRIRPRDHVHPLRPDT